MTDAKDPVCGHANCGKPRSSHIAHALGPYCFRIDANADPEQRFLAPEPQPSAAPVETRDEAMRAATPHAAPPSDDPADAGKGVVCEHGSLKRKCLTCEYEYEIAQLRAELAARDARIVELEKERDLSWRSHVSDGKEIVALRAQLADRRRDKRDALRDALIVKWCDLSEGDDCTDQDVIEQAACVAAAAYPDAAHGPLAEAGERGE